MSLRQAQDGTDLDARYGRRPARGRLVAIIAAAVILVAAAVVWFLWANPLSDQQFWKSTGYAIIGDSAIDITWNVTLGPGETAQCALAAENSAGAIVGWKVVEVTGTDNPTEQLTETVRTTEPAVTGLAYRCWLA